jgi:Short C-terminal domain
MQEAQTQSETKSKSKCCGKNGHHRAQRRGKCGSSHKHEANAATANPLEILQQRFARGEVDTAEFEEKRRLIANA